VGKASVEKVSNWHADCMIIRVCPGDEPGIFRVCPGYNKITSNMSPVQLEELLNIYQRE
jgi:hypothetical protein